MGRTTINLAEASIVLPSIENVLNSLEEDLFQADNHHPEVDLQHLDGLVERASSGSQTQGIDIDKMVTTLRSRRMNQPNTQWVWIIIVIVASIGFGALWPVWLKFIKKYCHWVGKYITCTLRPTRMNTAQKLNDDDTDSQIPPQGDGVVREGTTSRASSRDDPETQSALTGFVGTGA